jgi:esterase/lipase
LLQWGNADEYVSKNETDKIFGAIGSANKQLMIYEGVGHQHLLSANEQKWQTSVSEFLK